MPSLQYPYKETAIASLAFGNLINWLLHGVLTVQLYIYYLAFPQDMIWAKIAVYAVYALETAQAIGLGVILLLITVDSTASSLDLAIFYSYRSAPDPRWAAQALLIDLVGGLVAFIAQGLYAYQIWIMQKRVYQSAIIIILSVLQFVAAIMTAFTSKHFSTISVLVWTGINVIIDLTILIIMVRGLSKEKLLFGSTRSKVMRIIWLIIASGSLLVAANLVSHLSIAASDPPSVGCLIAMPVIVFTPKLYANSILVLLNNRMTIKRNTITTISSNLVSTFIMADPQIRSRDSAISCDKGGLSTAE